MDWSWAVEGVTEEVPRTTGPECINYMTNRRRWIESVLFTILFIIIMRWAVKRMDPIILPPQSEIDKPHSAVRLLLLISMTLIFGIELGFKLAGKSVIFVMNPCHIQTMIQIYLLASKPSKITIALFRIQMNNLNGPFLAFLFPEVENRTLPFEQGTYWIQHALLYIIPVYLIKSGAYKMEDISDFNWVTIGIMIMLIYHFVVLNAFSIMTDINLNHMLCAALADPFQGQNYRIAAVIHESILCPILNKVTVLIFSSDISKPKQMPLEIRVINKSNQTEQTSSSSSSLVASTTSTSPATTLYHQLQHQQHQSATDIKRTPLLVSSSSSSLPTQMSLAAEMAAAAGEPVVGNLLTHRHIALRNNHAADIDDAEAEILATAIASEYTMPTTKID